LSPIKINEKFDTLFKQPKGIRYYIVTGGRGSSKSFSIALWNCLKTFEQDSKTLYTRYTLISARKSIIPEFEEKINILNASDHFDVTNNEIINLETKSSILFSGIKTSSGNQTANLKSLQGVSCWILDEAEELVDELTFDKIDLSIRSKQSNNIVVLILNPTTKEHWIYKRFFEDKGVMDGFNGIKDDTCYIHTTYLDNKENLSTSFLNSIESIKANRPDKYKYQILGGWRNKAEGVIFTWDYGNMDNSLPYYYGLDFGFVNDPDACVKVAIDQKRNVIYLEEMFYEYGQQIETVAKRVKELERGQIVADSAEARLIDYLRKESQCPIRSVKKGAGSVLEGVKLMQNYTIKVCGDSPNLVKELNNYAWNGKAKEAPIDDWNHCFVGNTKIALANNNYKNIRDINEGDLVATQSGFNKVLKKFNNGYKNTYLYLIQIGTNNIYIRCTPNHKVKTSKGWKKISQLTLKDEIYQHSSLMGKNTIYTTKKDTSLRGVKDYIEWYGNIIKEKSLKDIIYITWMETLLITQLTTSTLLASLYMVGMKAKKGLKKILNSPKTFILRVLKQLKNGISLKRGGLGIKNMEKSLGLIDNTDSLNAKYVEKNTQQDIVEFQNTATQIVKLKRYGLEERKVYDIMVDENHEYFANGILVHNCIDAARYVVWTYANRQSEYVHLDTDVARFSRNEDTGYNNQVW